MLHIYFPSVPVPTPSISVSNTGTVYAGTPLSLTCDYTLSPSVDTSPDIAVTWMVNGTAVDTTPDRISIDGATLSFSPVATSDSGRYTCELSVTASQIHVTAQNSRQSTVDLLIQSNTLQISYLKICTCSICPPPSPPACCGHHYQPHCSSLCW